jgi:hypothetical protein
MTGDIERTMLSGFNTNFRYRGVLFHVQTEDSGLDNPHVITHLFHGGNVMASQKSDYSMLLSEEDVERAVRKMMEGQHKSMLKQLSRGEHDAVIAQRLGPEIFLPADEADGPPPSSTEDAPPLVVAEPMAIGTDSILAADLVEESILEPEFAQQPIPPEAGQDVSSVPPATPVASDATGDTPTGASAGERADRPADISAETPASPTDSMNSATPKSNQLARVFGDRVVSEKPLDEVVMDYLVDNARKRKRQPK